MTLDDLKVFVYVCEAGNLSAVARTLGCTQPAISQHISRLERELGVKLFERSAQGVTRTEAGSALMESAVESLNALSAGIDRVQEIQGHGRRHLTVTTGGTSVRHFLRDTVVKFRASHDDVTLQFLPANTTARCLELVRIGSADLALVTVHGAQRGVEQRILAQQDLRLLVPENDALAKRKRIRVRDLEGIDYIGLSEDTTSAGYLGDAFESEGVSVNQFMTVDDFDTACEFVELGLGFAIVPAVQAANFSKVSKVRGIPVTGLPALSIGLAARRWNALGDAAQKFVDVFQRQLARMSRLPGVTLLPGGQVHAAYPASVRP